MYYVVEPIGFKCFRPQQGLPIMNTLEEIEAKRNGLEFPSPTGVTYYEFMETFKDELVKFVSVPNRGYLLWILFNVALKSAKIVNCFRPQQGLPIMNHYKMNYRLAEICFRPQQGLPIMNNIYKQV